MRPPAIVTRAVRAGLFSVQSPDPGVAALQEVSQALYIIGLIAAAACALSVIMGVIYFLFTSLSVETSYYFMNYYWQALSSTCSLFLKDRLSILNHVH